MKIIIEEYPYKDDKAKSIISKVIPCETDGSLVSDYVGYYFSKELNDTVFFLPKVVIASNGKIFGNENYDPESLVDFTAAKDNGIVSDDDFQFIYGFAVWIYRAISEYKKEQLSLPESKRDRNTLHWRDWYSVGLEGEQIYNTYLDIIMSLIRFNDDNQDFFTFEVRNLHSGYNRINWAKTISHCQSFVQGDSVVYLDPINKKKQVNFDEELFVIYFSILNYLRTKYGFPVKLNLNYELITEDEFENYLEGYGVSRLNQIRYKYFSDKLIFLWQLCYVFFERSPVVNTAEKHDDYLIAKNFYVVFEAMIDHLLSDKDGRIDKLHLKEQIDGKRVDHIYAYDGLIHNQEKIFYIGDSKYYKYNDKPDGDAVYKQYTYARNVIQANLNLFNCEDKSKYKEGDDYLVYLDRSTEGYNITPNFLLCAHIDEKKNYGFDDLQRKKEWDPKSPNYHFENRLFDRDTLLLQCYDINFLYVISVYGGADIYEQKDFKSKAQKLFRDYIVEELEQKYQFFSLQLKSTAKACYSDSDDEDDLAEKDRMNRLIEQKYFHKLLGKSFRPYKEEEFLYLSLDNGEKYKEDNLKLLTELSTDFNIRQYKLGSNPKESINAFAKAACVDSTGAVEISQNPGDEYKFEDFSNEIFLVAPYVTSKPQKEWIDANNMYNIRTSNIFKSGNSRPGIVKIDEQTVSARFLILYGPDRKYDIYHIKNFKKRTADWMSTLKPEKGYTVVYPNPSGEYIVYTLGTKLSFQSLDIDSIINKFPGEKLAPHFVSGEWLKLFLTY